ncbi:MAG: hypothetical protein GWO04_21100, partial [Actinobacteria bacterium]|nr:hypothetical protein [Actinomycetota bacterium]
VVSEDDAAELFDARGEAAAVLEAMAEMTGVQQVVLTRGADGAAWMDGGAAGAVAPIDTQVLDPIGAGDAFSAGVIAGLLEGDLPGGVRRGAAMGAVEVGLYGDMLTVDPEEIDAVLDGAGRDVAR